MTKVNSARARVTRRTASSKRKAKRVADSAGDDIYLTGEAERALYNRLSRLEGQVRGVKQMLAEHKSCDAMLVQIAALKQAVNGIAVELLQAHMQTCVLGQIHAGEGERALEGLRNALTRVVKHG